MLKPKWTWRDYLFATTSDGTQIVPLALCMALVVVCLAAALAKVLHAMQIPF